jgi:hypothetical protein
MAWIEVLDVQDLQAKIHPHRERNEETPWERKQNIKQDFTLLVCQSEALALVLGASMAPDLMASASVLAGV